MSETLTQFDVVFHRRSVSDFVAVQLDRSRADVIQSVTACVWLRTDDLLNYGTAWSYAVDNSWLTAEAAANAFTAYDYASLKVNHRSTLGERKPPLNVYSRLKDPD